MGNKILVTGGAGYVGSVLLPILLNKGYKVCVLDKFYFGESSIESIKNDPNLELIRLDIAHHENIPNLFKNVESIVHLASISNDPSGDLDPNLTIQTNFLATMSLARRAKAEGVKRFIFVSSCSVYGAGGSLFLNERSRLAPVTLYALSKLQCENELMLLADSRFSVTILRFATLFGYSPRMRFDLAINIMIKTALQEKSLILHGNGSQYRPFLHVRDAARAIVTVVEKKVSTVGKQIFNVGNSTMNFRIKDLIRSIQTYFPNLIVEKIENNNDTRSYRVNCKKFKMICSFSAEFDLAYGLKEIKEAFESVEPSSMDREEFYNVEVMKKIIKKPLITYSLASSPRWNNHK